MPGFNAVPGQVCTYPGNVVPAESSCTGPVAYRRNSHHALKRPHNVASPRDFLERPTNPILKVANGPQPYGPDGTATAP